MDAVPITKKLIAFGSNKIYLPKFTVALLRTPTLSPYHARFQVPLDFSKYDLRDYLYHAYNVKCFNVRSYVKQMPVRDTREQPRHWFRPESKKYMTVEMELPFVWPETPNLEPWGKNAKQQEVKDSISANNPDSKEEVRKSARVLKEQVGTLLGKREAKNLSTTGGRQAELTESERLEEKERQRLKTKSPLEVWEQKRSGKVVRSEEAERFTIKA
ncbi:mitochondrial ribosomal protein subunit L23 [Dothidotthia symphoricarpi CBS 119687]|uniref:Large ribosomal subunit protein uL23m n=1 Tax=Dothidotthia symphoricarpi CBS 119687 TaxID=1392245 RepID=A0A6A6AII5_9PLEO|nr:mitochondrial ribosomal protein subunit L23 [Dothidotthia symphoricarpi CBS 119687]KAF2131620.1 mitochondrial ribosomal protein subunit L23 [Dothidotthia symphoricarpi CBS 119687]